MEVARFYNQTKDDFDPQVYKDFISHLYRRAKNVISTVEQISQSGTIPPSIAKLIKEAVYKDNEVYNNSLALATRKNQKLQKESDEKEKQIEDIKNAVANLKDKVDGSNKQIGDLESEKNKLSDSLQQHKKKLQKTTAELLQSRQEQEKANRKIKLYKEQEDLSRKIKDIETELEPMQRNRKEAFKNHRPKYFMIGGWVTLFLGVLVLLFVIYGLLESWTISILCAVWSASWFLFNRMSALNNMEEKRANKEYAKWETKNPRYGILIRDLQKLNERLKEINEDMQVSTNNA